VVAREQCASPRGRRLRRSTEGAAYPEAGGRGEEEPGAVAVEEAVVVAASEVAVKALPALHSDDAGAAEDWWSSA